MILVKTPQLTEVAEFPSSNSCVLINTFTDLNGEKYFQYEVTLNVNTMKILAHDLAEVEFTALIGSLRLPTSIAANNQKGTNSMPLIDNIDRPEAAGFIMSANTISAQDKNTLLARNIKPGSQILPKGISSNSIIAKNTNLSVGNSSIKQAVNGGFANQMLNAVMKKYKRFQILDKTSANILTYLHPKARDLSVKLKRGTSSRSKSLSPKSTNRPVSNANFALSDLRFQFVTAQSIVSNLPASSQLGPLFLEGTVNYRNISAPTVSSVGDEPGYVKPPPGLANSPAVSPLGNSTMTRPITKNLKSASKLPRQLDIPANNVGSTIFAPTPQIACLRAIYEHGIPPTALIPVNVECTIQSTMQIYQGTSQVKNNGY